MSDIEYYDDYKKRLIQYITVMCCYHKAYSSEVNQKNPVHKRHHITHREMLGLMKEILSLEILIYKLKKQDNAYIQ